jgi:hypothetical protein
MAKKRQTPPPSPLEGGGKVEMNIDLHVHGRTNLYHYRSQGSSGISQYLPSVDCGDEFQ